MCKFGINLLPMDELLSQAMKHKISTPTWGWIMERSPRFSCSVKNQPELPPDQHLEVGELGEPFSHHRSPPIFETRNMRTHVTFWSILKARHLLCWPKVSQQIWLQKAHEELLSEDKMLTSRDEFRKAAATTPWFFTRFLIFLNDATTGMGTARKIIL